MDFGKILGDLAGDVMSGKTTTKKTTSKRSTRTTSRKEGSNLDIAEIAKDVMAPGSLTDKAKNLADEIIGNGDGKLDASDVMGKLFGK